MVREARPNQDEAKAEAASAGMVVQTLIKADRGFAIYLPNNPLHEKFFEDFRKRCEEHLEEFGSLRLDLTHDSIQCGGETIYTNAELRENLAFRMYADGLRALRVEEGVEPLELHTLVEILGRSAAEDDEDDIVTRLWSADLQHVTYVVTEPPQEGGPVALAPSGSWSDQAGAIRRYAAELAAAPSPPGPTQGTPQESPQGWAQGPPLAQQIFSLSDEEIGTLQELLARDERRSPLEDMAAILEAIIAAERESAVAGEILGIIARLCGDLLITGRVGHAVELLAMLERAAARPGVPPESVAMIEGARAQVITPDVFAGLSRILAAGEGIERGLLRSLVAGLGRSAIEPFCRILGAVRSKDTRKVLIDALAEAGRGSPELFLPFLLDSRWYLVRNTLYILRRIADPETARAVVACANHADPRVRKEVVHYFDETGDPAGEPVMLAYLYDAPPLRMAAARNLARHGSRAAAERLLALTTAPGFAERERLEREVVWEALGALVPARVFPTLAGMLLKRRWFGQSREIDDTACACAGLRRIGTPEAVEALRRAAAAKRGEARELVERSLRAIARGRGPDDGDGGEEGNG